MSGGDSGLKQLEDRGDTLQTIAATKIANTMAASLKDHEEVFFEEIIKNLYIDGKDSFSQISKIIQTVIQSHSNYVQEVPEYKLCAYSAAQEEALSIYTEILTQKLLAGCTDQEINKIFGLFVPFIQQKRIDSDTGDVLPEDISKFVHIELDFLPTKKLPQIQEILEKMVAKSKFPTRNESTYSDLYKNLQNESFNIFRNKDLSDKDQGNLLQIENDLKRMFLNNHTYKNKIPADFISYFFASIIEKNINKWEDTISLIEEMIIKYKISGDKETIKTYLYDCFERLKKIATRKNNQ